MTSSIGGASGFSSAGLAQMREQMFNKLDADGSGGIDETEFANGPSGSTGSAGGMDSGIASALFTAFDSDSDGSLTQDELDTGFQKLSSSMRSVLIGTQEDGGAGGPGGAGGADRPHGPPPRPEETSESDDSDSSLDTLLSLLQNLNSSSTDETSDDSSGSTASDAKSAVQNDFKQLLNDLQKLVQGTGTGSTTSVSA